MVTLAAGLVLRTTVNVAALPLSFVDNEVGVTVTPATSLSLLVTETSVGLMPLYNGSVLVVAAVIMVYV